jgi:hypothetical protein
VKRAGCASLIAVASSASRHLSNILFNRCFDPVNASKTLICVDVSERAGRVPCCTKSSQSRAIVAALFLTFLNDEAGQKMRNQPSANLRGN